MWRFMLVTFGFLGWAFYEMSGGANYSPAENSLQVAWADKPLFARPADAPLRVARIAPGTAAEPDAPEPEITETLANKRDTVIATLRESEAQLALDVATVTRSDAALSGADLGGFSITLASTADPVPTQGNQPLVEGLTLDGLGGFSAETLVRNVNLVPMDQAVISTDTAQADMRSVARARANMRQGPSTDFGRVAQLSEGAAVEVLDQADNGWVKLRDMETGQVGWMADWLVTAAAN